MNYIGDVLPNGAHTHHIIDTLPLSVLLFPAKTSHALGKSEKISEDALNNPLIDARKCRALFLEELQEYCRLDENKRLIYKALLSHSDVFSGFYHFLRDLFHDSDDPCEDPDAVVDRIRQEAVSSLVDLPFCPNAPFHELVDEHPVETALALSYAFAPKSNRHLSQWAVTRYPELATVIEKLCCKPCKDTSCPYCLAQLNPYAQLKKYFGYTSFRTWNGEELQRDAVQAAIDGKSLIAVFPTGGGKSLTFQLPALMAGENIDGLTVVISPLQSLMKDQVDNLSKRGIPLAATINGQLDPVTRVANIDAVRTGVASILYIAPESLRSPTIEHLIAGRNLVRVVVDEAHCFSTWGQDFRVDYLYIGEFIKKMEELHHRRIPVSCFTATAKPKVISDICEYFLNTTGAVLEKHIAESERKNLHYQVLAVDGESKKDEDNAKYHRLRELVQEKNCPTIVFVTRRTRAEKLAERLTKDGFPACAFHGGMDNDTKIRNQEAFIKGDRDVIVATKAFGMGVDKKDIGLIVHFDISESLEDYVQESGRAGRDESVQADCYVLYNERDLDGHFAMLNQQRVTISQIQQVWRAVKAMTGRRKRMELTVSALEIAREAGWDEDNSDVETRVRTALQALEQSGYIKRGLNNTHVYASSINVNNISEARRKLAEKGDLNEEDITSCIRIISSLLSQKSVTRAADAEAESRVDYLCDNLDMDKNQVLRCIDEMKSCGVLEDDTDLTARIPVKAVNSVSRSSLEYTVQLEQFLVEYVKNNQTLLYKEANSTASDKGISTSTVKRIKQITSYWIRTHLIHKPQHFSKEGLRIEFTHDYESFAKNVDERIRLSKSILDYLTGKALHTSREADIHGDENVPVNFSLVELQHLPAQMTIDSVTASDDTVTTSQSLDNVRKAVLYLDMTKALDVEGGFLVCYNGMRITRVEKNNRRQYRKSDYEKLETFYKNKTEQIHIVGRFASMMTKSYQSALQFVRDYFQMDYQEFTKKYFTPKERGELARGITARQYDRLFGELNNEQMRIIKDSEHRVIVVAAGPGSGKTRTLVHKLASLLWLEQTWAEQLLMLTFSNAAAMEFATRLHELVGDMSYHVEIRTFHSYAFDLLGRVGNLKEVDNIEKIAAETIREQTESIEQTKWMKTCLVIDEAQDMSADEFDLVKALIEKNPDMRVIAVGDDDQAIMGFRGASPQYMRALLDCDDSVCYELTCNYRSATSIVAASNALIGMSHNRIKKSEVRAVRSDCGDVECVCTPNRSIVRIVNRVVADRAHYGDSFGTSAVITYTNEDAVLAAFLLKQSGVDCQLIQNQGEFRADMLCELHIFLCWLRDKCHIIASPAEYEEIIRILKERMSESDRLDDAVNILERYQKSVRNVYVSDLEEMLRNSSFEDLVQTGGSRVCVSTFHKAKGHEFDNVYCDVSAGNFGGITSAGGRPRNQGDRPLNTLYVGMTRARNRLILFDSAGVFVPLQSVLEGNGVAFTHDDSVLPQPDTIAIPFTMHDINLGDFKKDSFWNGKAGHVLSGQDLDAKIHTWSNGDQSLYFIVPGLTRYEGGFRASKSKWEELSANWLSKGYKLCGDATANYVVYWHDDQTQREWRVILPLLYLSRS